MRERGTSERARVLALFAGLALALYLFVVTEVASSAPHFLAANRLGPTLRDRAAFGALAVPFGATLAALVATARRPALWDSLGTLVDAFCPALVLPFLPGLFERALWKDSTLELLVLCAGLAAFLEFSLQRALPEWQRLVPALFSPDTPRLARARSWAARALLSAAVLYYALRIASLTLSNHQRLGTFSADLAEFDSLFFNALHGHPFRSPPIDGALENWSALKVHCELLLYALLPAYALGPGPETLLVLQAASVALSAVPLYLFAARRVGEPLALLFALALLLMPAVEQPNFFDFHFLPVGMLCVTTTICLADRVAEGAGRRVQIAFWIAFALSLASREDIAFGLTLLGLVLWANGRARRTGLIVTLSSLLWFAVLRFVVMPRFGEMWFVEMYETLRAPGREGALGVLETLLTNPVFVLKTLLTADRLLYLLELTVPLAFLWLRRPWLALAALPGLPFTLLVTNRAALYQISFQYVYHFIPYIFAASVLGLEGLGPRGGTRQTAAAAALAFATFTVSFHQGAFLGTRSIQGGPVRVPFRISAVERQRAEHLARLVALIPPDASVAATEHEGPHVSTRLLPFTFYAARGHEPRYLLLSESAISKDELVLLQALEPQKYGVIAREGEFFLLERGRSNDAGRRLLEALRTRLPPKP